ncbi:MAG: hypothetical protein COT84_06515 [Chlamydiae bacterium CG10_big_fil_rev_8_21_14_0_10_35_9]|nr:MAG: hypothetical protein COT84_06515 [Chlamydiae bacterium CG10_big_fil_rev_8_21_14_0_10_35_9]
MKKSYSVIYIAFLILISWVVNAESATFLVFGGKSGWFGNETIKIVEREGHIAICAHSRLENREEIIEELSEVRPDFIINAAGITGRPNIDWCEDHKEETICANVLGCLNLIDIAWRQGIHVTNFGTGCFYDFDEDHPMGSGKGFKEEDEPNHFSSFYSRTKVYLEKIMLNYPNVLNLRFRMPVSFDYHPRNFIVKISRYKKVINIPNSLSVLEDLLPIAVDMTLKRKKGNYNFTNPGAISHNDVLELYKLYVDPDFTYSNFSAKEQGLILKAGRSNCELDVSKLLKDYPNIPHIRDSIIKALQEMHRLKLSKSSN